MDFFQIFGLVVGLVSAGAAIASAFLAWKAVKETKKNNDASLIVQLHSLYHTDKIFKAIQMCWDMYNPYQETAGNIPLSSQKAKDFVNATSRDSDEWKVVHDLSSFWRYVALLVRTGYLSPEIAFSAFSNPDILGFLYPIEKEFVQDCVYERSLECLYDDWKDWKKPTHPKLKTG